MKSKLGLAGIIVGGSAALVVVALWIGKEAQKGTFVTAPAAHIDAAAVRAKAQQGEPQAQWQLGDLYALGEGVQFSYAEAAKWYQRGAEQGNPDAEAALGELYQAGRGVGKDLAAASKWFRLAAAQHNLKAQYSLGFMCETGRGQPLDQAEAAKWYRLAAEQGTRRPSTIWASVTIWAAACPWTGWRR
jgi:TPR repeat protein